MFIGPGRCHNYVPGFLMAGFGYLYQSVVRMGVQGEILTRIGGLLVPDGH